MLNGGNGNDFLVGDSGNDTLLGDKGVDTLEGRSGDDILKGGSGSDALLGGSGNDILFGGSGNDTLNGGSGIDTVDYSTSSQGVFVGLNVGTATGDGTDNLLSIENATGSAFDDRLAGNHRDNLLVGGDGNDKMFGNKGDDSLYGGKGIDFLDGGSGDDFIFGNDGDDFLKGYNGADVLTGGSGSDTFIYRSSDSYGDVITDFNPNEDYLDVGVLLGGMGFSALTNSVTNWLRVVDNGEGDALLQADLTGSGSAWDDTVATLEDVEANEIDNAVFIIDIV